MNPAPASTTAEKAIVLSGGGAYGAFEVGVLKVLFAGRSPATRYLPLHAGILTGTSCGAFNAAMLSSHAHHPQEAVHHLEAIWRTDVAEPPGGGSNGVYRLVGDVYDYLSPQALRSPDRAVASLARDSLVLSRYTVARTADFAASRQSLSERLIGAVNLSSFIDLSPFEQLLRKVVREQQIYTSSSRLTIIATSWLSGEARTFTNADFRGGFGIKAILGTAAIPGVFPPVRIGSDLCADGGVIENTPLKPAIIAGATELHVIYLNPSPRVVPLPGSPNTLNSFLRTYSIMMATKLNEDIETARWVNDGLRAIAVLRSGGTLSNTRLRDFVRFIGQFSRQDLPYRPITIHRYFPESALGGDLGMLDFASATVAKMIEEGERVALLHDCQKNRCLLPAPGAA